VDQALAAGACREHAVACQVFTVTFQDDALEEAAYEDIPGITVRRHRLEDWVDKPFLERVLPGCLVRLSLGERASHSGGGTNKIYALAQVGLLATRPHEHQDCGSLLSASSGADCRSS
jgi:Plus-3 domain